MNKEQVEQIIQEYFTKNGGTTGSFATSLHTHNGSDSLQIPFSNIFIANAIQLPDAPRPASPFKGMIAFDGGMFYACQVTGTWRTIVTA